MVYQNITECIGNTPLLKIDPSVHGLKNVELYAKLESYNPFGSVKDRVAHYMLKDDIKSIKDENKTVIEASSGNTAKALAALCAVNDIPFTTVTNRIKVPEVKQILQVLGAELVELPGLAECPDPTDPNNPVAVIEEMKATEPDKYFHTSQYTNPKNLEAHFSTTGKEIQNDLGKVDYFFGGLGTTGSTRGTAEYLKQHNSDIKVIGIVGEKGDFFPGIRNLDEMLEVGLFEKSYYDKIQVVTSSNSVDMMLKLIRKCGILAGPTSGSSFEGAVAYLKAIDETLNQKVTAVFIVCDRLEWYMSYLQKRRPELFGIKPKENTPKTLSEDEINSAESIGIETVQTYIVNQSPIIVDSRSTYSYKVFHIQGAINLPDNYLEDILEAGIPFPKNKHILFVCPVGEQSKKYAAFLKKNGYQAMSLQGGIASWKRAGYELVRQ